MIIDEGGAPKGNLSDYVSGVFTERTQKETELQKLKDAEVQARLDQFVQKTTLLRNHLLQLAAPIDDLISRFRVGDLLEEARDILDSYTPKVPEEHTYIDPGNGCRTLWYPIRRMGYLVNKAVPMIYDQVVLDPREMKVTCLENDVVNLETVIDPVDFTTRIPRLWRYGLALSFLKNVNMVTTKKRHARIPSSGTFGPMGGPEGYGYIEITPAHWGWEYPHTLAKARVIKEILVEAVKGESETSGYDLMYSHYINRDDLRIEQSDRSLNKQVYLTAPVRIRSSDSGEVLKELIGKDLVRELNGEHEFLFYKLVNWGIMKNDQDGPVRV